jgi:hypothetical protein
MLCQDDVVRKTCEIEVRFWFPKTRLASLSLVVACFQALPVCSVQPWAILTTTQDSP